MFARAVFEAIEVKGGRMVKQRGFEAEKNQNKCKKMKYPTLVLCLLVIFWLEMGLNQQLSLKNQCSPLLTLSDF